MAELSGRPDLPDPPGDGGDSRTPGRDASTTPRETRTEQDRPARPRAGSNDRGSNNDAASIWAAMRASDQFAPDKPRPADPRTAPSSPDRERQKPDGSPPERHSGPKAELRPENKTELDTEPPIRPVETPGEVAELRRQLDKERAEKAELRAELTELKAERQKDKAEFDAKLDAFDQRMKRLEADSTRDAGPRDQVAPGVKDDADRNDIDGRTLSDDDINSRKNVEKRFRVLPEDGTLSWISSSVSVAAMGVGDALPPTAKYAAYAGAGLGWAVSTVQFLRGKSKRNADRPQG